MSICPTGDPETWVRIKAEEHLEVFRGTLRPDGSYKNRIFQSVCSTAQQISNDYGDRFLLELIQNGYDAHPPNEQQAPSKSILIQRNRATEFCM